MFSRSCYISGPHQAVSSMKMPSFSSCINTSPPGENKQVSLRAGCLVPTKLRAKKKGCLTTQILQDEVELPPSLECIQQIHNERVPHRLQDLPLGSRMGCVFGVTNNLSLQAEEQDGRLDEGEKRWQRGWQRTASFSHAGGSRRATLPFSGPSWQIFSPSELLEPSAPEKPDDTFQCCAFITCGTMHKFPTGVGKGCTLRISQLINSDYYNCKSNQQLPSAQHQFL